MKKFVVVALLAALIGGSGFALSFAHGPDCVQPGNVLISGGFGFGLFLIPDLSTSSGDPVNTLLGGSLAGLRPALGGFDRGARNGV
jgi:hypothetical protein